MTQISPVDVVWLLLSLAGIAVTLVSVHDAWGDRRALYAAGSLAGHDDPGMIIVRARLRTIVSRLWIFGCFVWIGIASMRTPTTLKTTHASGLAWSLIWGLTSIPLVLLYCGVQDVRGRIELRLRVARAEERERGAHAT